MKLFTRILGSGPPLLILHGFMGMSDNWMSVGKKLGKYFTVYIPDMRNHGQSPHSEEFGYQEMISDIEELLINENMEHFSILGHSMGGKLAMQLSILQSYRIQKCIVVDIGPLGKEENPEILGLLKIMQSINLKNFNSLGEIEKALQPQLPENRFRSFLLKNMHRPHDGNYQWKLNLSSLIKNASKMPVALSIPEPCRVPMLFIKGEKSDFMNTDDIHAIHEYFPNAIIRELPSAGHWVHADNPLDFMTLCIDFLLA